MPDNYIYCEADVTANVVSITLKDGKLIIIWRRPSERVFADDTPVPDDIWRDTYIAQDGAPIVLGHTKKGRHIPARVIPEQFIFLNDPEM